MIKRWGWLLRWGGTAAGIAYVIHVVDFAKIANRSFLHDFAFIHEYDLVCEINRFG